MHPHWTRSELVASALGYAGKILKWHSRQEFRLQPPRSKRGALYVELRESNEWRPRMDLHHQPPDPKAGALLIELQGYRKWRRTPDSHRVSRFCRPMARRFALCAALLRKWGDQWDSHPTRRLSQSRMLLLHHDLHLKWIRLPVLPRSGLVYKTSASAALPSRNEVAAPDGFAPSTSRVRIGRSAD